MIDVTGTIQCALLLHIYDLLKAKLNFFHFKVLLSSIRVPIWNTKKHKCWCWCIIIKLRQQQQQVSLQRLAQTNQECAMTQQREEKLAPELTRTIYNSGIALHICNGRWLNPNHVFHPYPHSYYAFCGIQIHIYIEQPRLLLTCNYYNHFDAATHQKFSQI